jgi:hypothetical protein
MQSNNPFSSSTYDDFEPVEVKPYSAGFSNTMYGSSSGKKAIDNGRSDPWSASGWETKNVSSPTSSRGTTNTAASSDEDPFR